MPIMMGNMSAKIQYYFGGRGLLITFDKRVARKQLMKKGDPSGSPLTICIYVQIRVIRGDYFFTNVFVTEPFSVVTRTKYMPSARPETLMRVGLSLTMTVLTNLPYTS